jgi:glutamate/tyrosine decarboxylase-like PLP-dependent enzyme
MEAVTMSPYQTESFAAQIARVRREFFSRDPARWPIFADPSMAGIIAFRNRHVPPGGRLKAYPDHAAEHAALLHHDQVPDDGRPIDEVNRRLVFAGALSKAWEDPGSVENVVTCPCDAAIHGAALGLLANPNLVYAEYAGMAEELERVVVKQIANLVGYDPALATGVFTQGGTFCNLYGYLFGIRKSMPSSLHYGLEHGQDYRMISSQGGHYSNTTNLSLLGVNIDKKTIRIQLTESHDIDIADLERQLTACFRLGCLVPTIMLTMGTTDTFGVDRVKPVRDLVDRLVAHFGLPVAPHIHVDSAVGWPMIFFLDYDFAANPLGILDHTLTGLHRNTERFRELRHADSFTVDFQKWGYVPYTSSLVMVKDRASMRALEHDPENFSYFEKDVQGQTHLQSTVECSRGAAGLFGAYAALECLGKRGYQTLIAHGLQNGDYLRACIGAAPGAVVVASENHGPSVGFRLYDPARVTDPEAEFAREKAWRESPEHHERLRRNRDYHRGVFQRRGKVGLYTNWIEFVTHTDYDERGRWQPLPGEKAVFFNPHTDRLHIDRFVAHLHG